MAKKLEFEIVKEFTKILGLENRTDGSLFIYKINEIGVSTKPDGYYYCDGITFILDAKAKGNRFTGQLEDYMRLERNPNKIGFKYSGDKFECFVNGKKIHDELFPKEASYYVSKFNFKPQTDVEIVNKSAEALADKFRSSGIDKQMNVPFIGAVMLCLKQHKPMIDNTTEGILRLIRSGIDDIIADEPLTKRQKKEFLKTTLGDETLLNSKPHDLHSIISEISIIYNFINLSDIKGHDTMNGFLRIFRKWNSANSKEKGEVFTPDHIASFMYKIIKCNKNDTILDPTCGSGTFLVNAMSNMLEGVEDEQTKRNIKENRLIGIENNMFNSTLAGINMMLHGDGASNIFYDDCFVKLPSLKNCYNKVLMNPPFSVVIPELEFVLQTLNFMSDNGLCAAILPISCAIGTQRKHKELKEKILSKHKLLKIIRLPDDLFQPNAGVKTCIIVFQAHIPHLNSTTQQFDFSDDGYKIYKHIGRININNEEKTKEFFNSSPSTTQLSFDDNWLLKKYFDYNTLKVSDFYFFKKEYYKHLLNLLYYDSSFEKLSNYDVNFDNFSLNNKNLINTDNWKEYKIKDLFIINKSKGFKTSQLEKTGTIPYVSRANKENGIPYFVKNKTKNYQKNQITIHHEWSNLWISYYQNTSFVTDGMIYILESKFDIFNWKIGLFIITLINKTFVVGNGSNKELVPEILIKLPIKNNQPDWKLMEQIVHSD